jgi:hypothetical protein
MCINRSANRPIDSQGIIIHRIFLVLEKSGTHLFVFVNLGHVTIHGMHQVCFILYEYRNIYKEKSKERSSSRMIRDIFI